MSRIYFKQKERNIKRRLFEVTCRKGRGKKKVMEELNMIKVHFLYM
jgi:hypothetical protein